MNAFTAKFYDGKRALAQDVRVEIKSYGLALHLGDEKPAEAWRFENISIIEKPKDRRPGRVGHTFTPEAQLIIEDTQVFAEIRSKLPKKTPLQGGFRWKFAGAIAALMAGLVLTVFWVLPMLASSLVPYFPKSWEAALGEAVAESFASKGRVCSTPEGNAALDELLTRLSARTELAYDYRIMVVDDDVENAFAAPGGYIVLYRPLLENMESPDELAAVLAHEMAHVEMQHGTESVIRNLSTYALLEFATGGSGTVLYIALQFMELSYTKEAERAADTFALDMLEKAGINAKGMADFFERLEKKEKAEGTDRFQFLSTHPASGERVEFVRSHPSYTLKQLPALHKGRWQALQSICGKSAADNNG